jgi:hypothetical protein
MIGRKGPSHERRSGDGGGVLGSDGDNGADNHGDCHGLGHRSKRSLYQKEEEEPVIHNLQAAEEEDPTIVLAPVPKLHKNGPKPEDREQRLADACLASMQLALKHTEKRDMLVKDALASLSTPDIQDAMALIKRTAQKPLPGKKARDPFSKMQELLERYDKALREVKEGDYDTGDAMKVLMDIGDDAQHLLRECRLPTCATRMPNIT